MSESTPARRWWLWLPLAAAIIYVADIAIYYSFAMRNGKSALHVYCAHDAEFAETILRDFEKESGIPVVIRYDTEATKSLGLVNLIIQERERPQCDVFWNNQVSTTLQLADEDLLVSYKGPGFERIPEQFKDAEGHWTGFAARMRVFIVNTDKMKAAEEAAEQALAGDDLSRVSIAKPLFGTTLVHYSVLWREWGGEKLREWHVETRKRGIREAGGNGGVKNLVAEGACDLGFTDTDDFFVARDEKKPVAMLPIRVGGKTICIPNSVGIIRGTKRTEAAKKLVDYLLSAEVELKLAKSQARQIPLGSVEESEVPEDVQQLREWADDAYDLRRLGTARSECLKWLQAEYLQ